MSGRDALESPLRVACLQMEPRVGAKADNLARSLALVAEAAGAGAALLVLPELCNTGYVFATREEAFRLAEPVPDGESCRAWGEAARRLGVTIVAGIAERAGDALYNAAVVLGPDGPVGAYRKNHLWGDEALFFEPGDLGVPVFRTPFGRLAVAICYDVWFPETFRLAALQGADLLCVPTNWVPMPNQPSGLPVMANLLVMAGAHANGLFVAAADRVGVERGQPFLGRSLIVGSDGWPLAGPASPEAEEIVAATLNLSQARRGRRLNDVNHVLRDRRTDLYGEVLGAGIRKGWY
ncbi:(R)-stereoselective amidase [Methylobacterium crusticola]|uniref:(R)-stereoselective amidase n=1 Tax=Methylobacterium crusticola TaxID=1697972 RepID=A0ABQ4RAB7_9HYPH|nr:nitrilase family protein [Methylobacterium crusticola]GJD53721.1 (R)-stereoselective amidase [Methylobacterium crusticola]